MQTWEVISYLTLQWKLPVCCQDINCLTSPLQILQTPLQSFFFHAVGVCYFGNLHERKAPASTSRSPRNDCNTSCCCLRYLCFITGHRYFRWRLLKFPFLKNRMLQVFIKVFVDAKWPPVKRIPPLQTRFPVAFLKVNGWENQFSAWPPPHELLTQIRVPRCFKDANLTWAPHFWRSC